MLKKLTLFALVAVLALGSTACTKAHAAGAAGGAVLGAVAGGVLGHNIEGGSRTKGALLGAAMGAAAGTAGAEAHHQRVQHERRQDGRWRHPYDDRCDCSDCKYRRRHRIYDSQDYTPGYYDGGSYDSYDDGYGGGGYDEEW